MFADTEALRALDAITRTKPTIVALERTFASTSRGTALINRIKADPSLSGCEIRIVSPEKPSPEADEEIVHDLTASDAEATATLTAGGDAEVTPKPLDQRGTRRAPRFNIVDDVEVTADGNPATLVNLSVVGAQVISPTILKPNQRLRFSLPDAKRPLRFPAVVAWAAFEMPKSGPRYRAGLEFFDADEKAVKKFIDSNKKE